jgi:hypothetical protein
MIQVVIVFLLTLTLLIGCHALPGSPPAATSQPPELPVAPLTTRRVKQTAPFVWWEAETPEATNFPPSDRNPFAPATATEAAILSEGKWIGVEGKRPGSLFLEYRVNIPEAGRYFFYSRKFWHHGPFRWHWDEQPWQQVGDRVYLMDEAPMRKFVVANWVGLGTVNLTTGKHTLRIELTQNDGAAAFDCFVLTQAPMQARGKLKPDQRYQADLPGWFLFDSESDSFGQSPVDLRSLNEAVAGENGFIRARGEEFVQDKTGRPVRFWAVNTNLDVLYMDDASMRYMARFLAKRGVNLVRLHGPIWQETKIRTIRPEDVQRLFALIAALKQEGIYTCLSVYFPLWLKLDQNSGFPGYTGQHPFGLLFFNSQFQNLYYDWWRTLLTTRNPTTGKTLVDDPAVAMVELVNEDSLFFWTFTPYENIPAPQMEILERQFGQWLTTKYGAIANAFANWKLAEGDRIRGDEPSAGRVGILPPGELAGRRETQRAQDTATFLAEKQQQFFREAIAVLRRELGYKGLIYASNWITANARSLGALDKYSNTTADFMDRHGYFSPPHEGATASYALSSGDTYEDRSALLFPSSDPKQEHDFNLPILDIHYNGLPSTISEINWTMPNRFRADFPVLAATYGLLQGSDGFFFFVTNRHAWEPVLGKFEIASPTIMGQFPATAWLYRKGLLEAGKNAVDVSVTIDDLKALRGAPVPAPQNLDQLRAKDIPPGQSAQDNGISRIDPLAFLVGQVNLRFVDKPAASRQIDLSRLINSQSKTIRSSTGQLLWDYKKGLVTINAPQVQGVTGFLNQAGTLELPDIHITTDMDYGTVLLVSLDDRPLAQSGQMLLQVMSEEQNFGWKTTGYPKRQIDSIGQAPIVVRNLAGTVKLQRSDSRSLTVTALDWNGIPTSTIGNAARFTLQPNVFYYVINRS